MLLPLLIACSTDEQSDQKKNTFQPDPTKTTKQLIVYSGRSESMVSELFQMAEEDLGFTIDVQYGDTSNMVTKLLTEGDQSPADMIFAQSSGYLGALAKQDRLETLPDELLNSMEDKFRDDGKKWIGISGRLRVLVYDSSKIKVSDMPNSLKDLSDPIWKDRIGWAPNNGSFQAHVSALRHIWGEEETQKWLQGVKANNPKVYPKNAPQVKSVDEGKLEIGWVNHYYLHQLDKEETHAKNYSFPIQDGGNIMMLAGMGIRKGSQKTKEANQLLQWMISEKAQEYFAKHNFEYPTIHGIALHPKVTQIPQENLAVFKQSYLTDLGPTRVLIQKLQIQ
jgi:iron(III) transport system substrate-binding protein